MKTRAHRRLFGLRIGDKMPLVRRLEGQKNLKKVVESQSVLSYFVTV
jgi:hypothetical protein